MTKSKILQVMETGKNTWQGKELTKWAVQFENEDKGTLTTGFQENEKTPEIGDELEYEIEDKGFGPEIKAKREGGAGFAGKKFTPNPKKDALIVASGIVKSLIEAGMEEGTAKVSYAEWFKLSYYLISMDEDKLKEEAEALPF